MRILMRKWMEKSRKASETTRTVEKVLEVSDTQIHKKPKSLVQL